ncbi:amino acid ABC transporter permease [Paenibacillus barcinonensis]|uniref:Amino acid ABC transporter permease n=1 Tax=Paenibacillus barcinonensis TaxID=198119 RepID=A0A2V4WL91_PAEBA|nr:amino acid ABC transporter permease [Paenibacillus barcinonensis]PYE48296.1 L-cystine transport system permease protein [Paenibacillus barcinonensis]QKS56861.1 amino acid ABC transporter permease [Paenibacillus barcinonensis]
MGKAFDLSLVLDFVPELLRYLHITLIVLSGSIVLGLLGGVLLAVPRLYRIPVLSQLATLYISFMRGTPILIKLFLVYYGLPELLKPLGIDLSRTDPLLFVIVTYAFSDAASFAEIFRGAVRSVDKGQTEAAYAAGLTAFQSFRRIVVPQALVVAFPNMANTFIGSLKDTSLAFSIGVMDMVGRGQTLISATSHALEVYISLSIVYYVIVILLEKGFAVTERRLQRHERKQAVTGKAIRAAGRLKRIAG